MKAVGLAAGLALLVGAAGLCRDRVWIAGAESGAPQRAVELLLEKEGLAAAPANEAATFTACGPGDAILIDERALELLATRQDEVVMALEKCLQAGAGLIVVGRAAGALPRSERFDALLARAPAGPKQEPTHPGPFVLHVPDQSHPVTQSIPALRLEGAAAFAQGAAAVSCLIALVTPASRSEIQGAAASKELAFSPVAWTRERRGRVVVLALELTPHDRASRKDPEPPIPESEPKALAMLTARCIQWAAGGEVSIPAPPDLPVAAAALGRDDAGLAPGLQPIDGFYRGRQIAPVMGYLGAEWLERGEREATEEPEKVLDALAIEEGSIVADVGAGTGYFSVRLARRVGEKGKVYATDIQPEMLELLGARLRNESVTNVIPVLATETSTGLPADSVDLALLVDVYHELRRPQQTIDSIGASLKRPAAGRKPGRLVLVEYRGEDPTVPIKPLHRTTVIQVRHEIEPRGFRLVTVKEMLKQQHVLIFERTAEPPAAEDAKPPATEPAKPPSTKTSKPSK